MKNLKVKNTRLKKGKTPAHPLWMILSGLRLPGRGRMTVFFLTAVLGLVTIPPAWGDVPPTNPENVQPSPANPEQTENSSAIYSFIYPNSQASAAENDKNSSNRLLPGEDIPLFMMNRGGRLIAVPGIPLETMDELFRKLVGTTSPETVRLPDFIFHSVLAEGKVEKDVVRLNVHFQIETFSNGTVCVPLRFDEGILEVNEQGPQPVPQTNQAPKAGETLNEGETPNAGETPDEDKKPKAGETPKEGKKPKADETPKADGIPETDGDSAPDSEKNSSETDQKKSVQGPEVVSSVSVSGNIPVSEESDVHTPANSESENPTIYSEAAHRLHGLLPVEKRYEGPGQVWVEFSEERGFTAWIVGKGIHKIDLAFLVPYIRAHSGEKQIKIQVPYATMSELKLEIPQTQAESEHLSVSMTGGTMLKSPYFEPENQEEQALTPGENGNENVNKKDDEKEKQTGVAENQSVRGKTRLSVIRLGGSFWLSWSEAPQEKTASPDILEAEGLILAVITQDAVHYDARLKILRKNPDVNSFRIQLPANAELIPQSSPDYSIAYVQEEKGKEKKNSANHGPFVEVTLKKRQTGIVRVDVHAKLPVPSQNVGSEWFDMAGFSVLSAVRQAGYYAIKTTIGKHANWTPGAGMRRIEELPVPMELWEPVKNLEIGGDAGNRTGESPTELLTSGGTRTGMGSLEDGRKSESEVLEDVLNASAQESEPTPETETGKSRRVESDPYKPLDQTSNPADGNGAENLRAGTSEGNYGFGTGEGAGTSGLLDRSGRNGTGQTGSSEWEYTENPQMTWDAVFEYDAQPTPLWTRTVERTTRINIEPQYTISVMQDKLVLEATWNCTIRGGKISWIDINLNGWTFLSCGPESLTASEQINDISPTGSTSANISIPFNQPVGNHVLLTFRAERSLPVGAKSFEFQLPQKFRSQVPQFVFSSTPAELRILSVPQLEVTPDAEKCRRLVRQPASNLGTRDELGGSIPLVYRCESEEALFAANILVHERQTHIKQYSQVELYRQEYHVRQTFSFSVAYKSINQLHFLIPEVNIENLEFSLSTAPGTEKRPVKRLENGQVTTPYEMNFLSMKPPIPNEWNEGNFALNGPEAPASRDSSTVFPSQKMEKEKPHKAEEATNAPSESETKEEPTESETKDESSESGTKNEPSESGLTEEEAAAESVPEPTVERSSNEETEAEETAPGENFSPEETIPPAETEDSSTPKTESVPTLNEPGSRPVLKFRPSQEQPGFMEVDALLPEELLGTFTISVSYTKLMPHMNEGKVSEIEILLASSRDGNTTENLLELASDECLEMTSPTQQNAESPWEEMGTFLVQNQFRREKELGEKTRNILPQFLCKTEGVQNRIQVGASLRSVSLQEITLIDRCWIQSWISGTNRQDRAVFLFPPATDASGGNLRNGNISRGTSASSTLLPIRKFTICLPTQASADAAEVWIDRKPAQFGTELKRLSASSIQVILPPAAVPNRPQSVEIRCQFQISPLSEKCCDLEVPYVKDSTWIRSVYWQILLPENLHIMQVPKGFSLEYHWGWNQCFWGRVPLWEQETLERWVGAVKGTPIPKRLNRYVLAGMGANEVLSRPIHIQIVNRTTLVAGLAVCVFLGGFLMIYFKILQRPCVRFLLLILLGGFALRFPEFALLGLQAATLGFFVLFISIMCGLRQKMRHQIFVLESNNEKTQYKTQIHQTVVAPSENSRHAFKTISYEQSLGVSDSAKESTVVRSR